MGRIILHLGPEKCGSTSIQNAVSGPDGALAHLTAAVLLNPYETIALEQDDPGKDLLAKFHQIIEGQQAAHPGKPLILSHEMVFKSGPILRRLAQIAQAHSDDVMAVAYLRRQSDFLVSAYGQWFFRSPERLRESADVLRGEHMDPVLFWGVERHLIACILGGWHHGRQFSGHVLFDWEKTAQAARSVLDPLGIRLSIGVLPRETGGMTLAQDFAERAGLGDTLTMTDKPLQNPSFHPLLLEAIACATMAGHTMPAPGEANNFLRETSAMNLGPKPELPFLDRLKLAVDSAFAASNARVAQDYGIAAGYFAPDQTITTDEIRAEIRAEAARRAPFRTELEGARAAKAAMATAAWGWFCKCSEGHS